MSPVNLQALPLWHFELASSVPSPSQITSKWLVTVHQLKPSLYPLLASTHYIKQSECTKCIKKKSERNNCQRNWTCLSISSIMLFSFRHALCNVHPFISRPKALESIIFYNTDRLLPLLTFTFNIPKIVPISGWKPKYLRPKRSDFWDRNNWLILFVLFIVLLNKVWRLTCQWLDLV